MATGISFPSELRVPDRDGYGEAFEETRSRVEMEAGPERRRNKYRTPPRLFNLSWVFTQPHFQIFDTWWQNTIKGGALPFDVRLLDADQTVVWYTVTAKGVYSAEVVNEQEWKVTLQVKALGENFGLTRGPGTDLLRTRITVGLSSAKGALVVQKPLRGATAIGVTGAGRMSLPGLRTQTEVGMFRLPRGNLKVGP